MQRCVKRSDPVTMMCRGCRAGNPTSAEASPACNGVASSRNVGLSASVELVPHSTVYRARSESRILNPARADPACNGVRGQLASWPTGALFLLEPIDTDPCPGLFSGAHADGAPSRSMRRVAVLIVLDAPRRSWAGPPPPPGSLEVPPLSGASSPFHPSGGGAYVIRRPTRWNRDAYSCGSEASSGYDLALVAGERDAGRVERPGLPLEAPAPREVRNVRTPGP